MVSDGVCGEIFDFNVGFLENIDVLVMFMLVSCNGFIDGNILISLSGGIVLFNVLWI